MKKYIVCVILLLLPIRIARILLWFNKDVKLSPKARIGLSVILVDKISLDDGAYIGSLNYIRCQSLKIGKRGIIRHLNIIKGVFDLQMGEQTKINRNTTIVNSMNIPELKKAYSIPSLNLGYNSIIGVRHFLDMTGSITIGENSILAGRSSELWTHGFYHAQKGDERWMIRGDINIGDNCYIGSHTLFNLGCSVCNGVTIGAGSIVSKDIKMGGAYVSQPLRHIEFVPEVAIKRYRTSDGQHYEKN